MNRYGKIEYEGSDGIGWVGSFTERACDWCFRGAERSGSVLLGNIKDREMSSRQGYSVYLSTDVADML